MSGATKLRKLTSNVEVVAGSTSLQASRIMPSPAQMGLQGADMARQHSQQAGCMATDMERQPSQQAVHFAADPRESVKIPMTALGKSPSWTSTERGGKGPSQQGDTPWGEKGPRKSADGLSYAEEELETLEAAESCCQAWAAGSPLAVSNCHMLHFLTTLGPQHTRSDSGSAPQLSGLADKDAKVKWKSHQGLKLSNRVADSGRQAEKANAAVLQRNSTHGALVEVAPGMKPLQPGELPLW